MEQVSWDSPEVTGFTPNITPLSILGPAKGGSTIQSACKRFLELCYSLLGIFLVASTTVVVIIAVLAVSYRKDEGYEEGGEYARWFSGFVQVKNGKFEMYCRPYYIAGLNAEDLIQIATLRNSNYKLQNRVSGRHRVRLMFNEASQAGLNVVRMWAHTQHPLFPFKSFNRETGEGKYHGKTFEKLDFVLNEARLHGMKVILSFIDNWGYHNGVGQFVDWGSGVPERMGPIPMTMADIQDLPEDRKEYEAQRHAHFFNDTSVKHLYKEHVKTIINRKNTYHGRLYKDDPTILAWDLINEPRCEVGISANCAQSLHAWINEMSAYVKSLDPNHLVTIGAEGFFGPGEKWEEKNPASWSSEFGNSFIRDHKIKNIDYTSIHIWPDNWKRVDPEFYHDWIESHVNASSTLIGKPLLIEEFGKKLEKGDEAISDKVAAIRDPVYNLTYRLVKEHIQENTSGRLVGSLFWRYHIPTYKNHPRSEYSVDKRDPTFSLIKEHTDFIKKLVNFQPPTAACETECWVAFVHNQYQTCVSAPHACQKYWEIRHSKSSQGEREDVKVLILNKEVHLAGMQFFASKADCCFPGLGAFPNGCTNILGWSPR